MTINLPKDLENSVHAEIQRGHFATADEMVAEAVRAYLRLQNARQGDEDYLEAEDQAPSPRKPIWEVIEEDNRSIPPEVWEALPTDLSAEHDHYIYGTPKRTDQ